MARSRSSAGCRPTDSAASCATRSPSRRRRPVAGRADRRADHPGDRRARRGRGRDAIGSTPADTSAAGLSLEAIERRAARRGPRAVHVGTLGLVLEPVATALGGRDRRRSASRRSSCSIRTAGRASIRDRAAYLDRLERIASAGRRRQGQRRRPRLSRAGPVACGCRRGHPRRAAPAVVLVTDGPRPVLIVTTAGVAPGPGPGGRGRRYGRCRRRVRRRVSSPAGSSAEPVAAELADSAARPRRGRARRRGRGP